MSNQPVLKSIKNDDSEVDTDYEADDICIRPIPLITSGRDKRKCESGNNIPHRTPSNANRLDWHNAYITQLMEMYRIIADTMNERYPKNKIKWDRNTEIVHNMSRLIYHCSSKHISEYVELPYDEDENESKDLNY